MTLGALEQARQGLREYQRRFARAADDVVRAGTGAAAPVDGAAGPHADEAAAATRPAEVLDAAERLLRAEHGLRACLAVARAGERMLGTVIDTLA